MGGLAPGQTSDSTELVLCLADALASSGLAGHFPVEDIALRYGKWGQTVPFHAEQACGQAFRGALSAEAMTERAKNQNRRALGAGALVRCPLLGAFSILKPSAGEAAAVARTDTGLSHPNMCLGEASAAYVVLARSLIMRQGNRTAALAELREWMEAEAARREGPQSLAVSGTSPTGGWVHIEQREKPKTVSGKEEEYIAPGASLVAFKDVMSWVSLAFADTDLPFTEERLPSSARVAFTHAFRQLNLGSSFEEAMRATLAGGGDCSANAAIVGGLIGASVGLESIPSRWIRAILACETVHGQLRPQEYHPGRLPELLEKIVSAK